MDGCPSPNFRAEAAELTCDVLVLDLSQSWARKNRQSSLTAGMTGGRIEVCQCEGI